MIVCPNRAYNSTRAFSSPSIYLKHSIKKEPVSGEGGRGGLPRQSCPVIGYLGGDPQWGVAGSKAVVVLTVGL